MSETCHRCYKVVPRACTSDAERLDCPNTHRKGVHAWTAYCRWPGGDVEEIDVAAPDEAAARKLAEEALVDDYQPGGKIIRMVCREAP